MKKRTIDLRGVNSHNKGAHLMLLAITSRLGASFDLSMSPNGAAYSTRARLGLSQTVILNQAPRVTASIGNFAPKPLRRAFGLASSADLDGVLDAAGFAYSDSFAPTRSKREAVLARGWARRGKPHILLPQAFGPFSKPEQRKWSRELLGSSTVVFARDRQSYDFVRELDESINVKLSPDFTIGLKPAGIDRQISGEYGAIVPNSKLVSHSRLTRDAYVDMLSEAATAIKKSGLQPVVVVHEFNDRELARAVNARTDATLFEHGDPLVLKKVLGDAAIVVASRYHAIVSTLASATPVLALGWSHKYEELLDDFAAGEWLLTPEDNVTDRVNATLADGETLASVQEKIPELLRQNDAMWLEVESTLLAARR